MELGEVIKEIQIGNYPDNSSTFLDSKRCVIGRKNGSNNVIQLWSFEEEKILRSFNGHTNEIIALDVTSDNKTLISASRDKTVKIWDIEATSPLIETLNDFVGWLSDVKISNNNKMFATSSLDKTVKLWDLETRKLISNLENNGELPTDYMTNLNFSMDGRYLIGRSSLASNGNQTYLKIWDCQSKTLLKTIDTSKDKDKGGSSMVLKKDNSTLIYEQGKNINIVDWRSDKTIGVLQSDIQLIGKMLLSKDEKILIVGGIGRTEFWNLETLKLINSFDYYFVNMKIYEDELLLNGLNSYKIAQLYVDLNNLEESVENINKILLLKDSVIYDKDDMIVKDPIDNTLMKNRGIEPKDLTKEQKESIIKGETSLISDKSFSINTTADKDLSLEDHNRHVGEVLLTKDGNVPIGKIKGYSSPQIMLPTKDIRFSRLKEISKIHITANDENSRVRIIYSLDSGKTWKSKKLTNGKYVDTIIDIEDLEQVKDNSLTINEFNQVNKLWTEDILSAGKIRFGYYLEIDNINEVSEVDEIKMELTLHGGWTSQHDLDTYDIIMSNNMYQVILYKNGTYKINY